MNPSVMDGPFHSPWSANLSVGDGLRTGGHSEDCATRRLDKHTKICGMESGKLRTVSEDPVPGGGPLPMTQPPAPDPRDFMRTPGEDRLQYPGHRHPLYQDVWHTIKTKSVKQKRMTHTISDSDMLNTIMGIKRPPKEEIGRAHV